MHHRQTPALFYMFYFSLFLNKAIHTWLLNSLTVWVVIGHDGSKRFLKEYLSVSVHIHSFSVCQSSKVLMHDLISRWITVIVTPIYCCKPPDTYPLESFFSDKLVSTVCHEELLIFKHLKISWLNLAGDSWTYGRGRWKHKWRKPEVLFFSANEKWWLIFPIFVSPIAQIG